MAPDIIEHIETHSVQTQAIVYNHRPNFFVTYFYNDKLHVQYILCNIVKYIWCCGRNQYYTKKALG